LGQDFEKTWESIKIVLTYVEDKCVFYIPWLEESCLKRQQYCESRRTNRLQSMIKPIKHMSNISKTYVEHMEDENEDVINNVIKDDIKDRDTKGKERTWRTSFWFYRKQVILAYRDIINSPATIKQQQEVNPNLDIQLSIKKAVINFWGTKAGWKYKKGKKAAEINMKSTLINSIDHNKVYTQRGSKNVSAGRERSTGNRENIGKQGYDSNGNPLGATARPGEFEEGVITLEGVPDHRAAQNVQAGKLKQP